MALAVCRRRSRPRHQASRRLGSDRYWPQTGAEVQALLDKIASLEFASAADIRDAFGE